MDVELVVSHPDYRLGDIVAFNPGDQDQLNPDFAELVVNGRGERLSARLFDPEFTTCHQVVRRDYPLHITYDSLFITHEGRVEGLADTLIESYDPAPLVKVQSDVERAGRRCWIAGTHIWVITQVERAAFCTVEVRAYERPWFGTPDPESGLSQKRDAGASVGVVRVGMRALFRV